MAGLGRTITALAALLLTAQMAFAADRGVRLAEPAWADRPGVDLTGAALGLDLQVVPYDVFGSDREILRSLEQGFVNLAVVSAAALAETRAGAMLATTSLYGLGADRARAVLEDPAVARNLDAAFAERGLRRLATIMDPLVLVSTGRECLTRPRDVEGRRIAVSPLFAPPLQRAGAAAFQIGLAEIVPALQAGAAAAALVSIDAATASRLDRVATCAATIAHTPLHVLANARSFGSLTGPDQRRVEAFATMFAQNEQDRRTRAAAELTSLTGAKSDADAILRAWAALGAEGLRDQAKAFDSAQRGTAEALLAAQGGG